MDREDIKAEIRKAGATMNELARRHGYSVTAVRKVLRRPYPAIEAIVAAHLGMKPQTIWPTRYTADGAPLRGRLSSKANTSRGPASPHRQKHEAL